VQEKLPQTTIITAGHQFVLVEYHAKLSIAYSMASLEQAAV
jgi:hypothetical protein